MVAQLGPRDWYIKKQKLLYNADNNIGRKKCHYMLYVKNNIARNTNIWKFELYRFKVNLFTLYTIRVRHSAAACRGDRGKMIHGAK